MHAHYGKKFKILRGEEKNFMFYHSNKTIANI